MNRTHLRKVGVLALVGMLSLATGCTETWQKEFRDAAGDQLQDGISTVVNGFIDGVFAVLETEEDMTEGTTSTP